MADPARERRVKTTTPPATRNDLADIERLYWQLDAGNICYQPRHFLRADRPDDFLLGMIGDPKSAFLLMQVDNVTAGFALVQEKQAPNINWVKTEKYLYVIDRSSTKQDDAAGWGRSSWTPARTGAGSATWRFSGFPYSRERSCHSVP